LAGGFARSAFGNSPLRLPADRLAKLFRPLGERRFSLAV